MNVLLTGGYGCIGSWIARNLILEGHHVWIYDLKQDLHRLQLLLPEELLSKVGFIQGDVTDLQNLNRSFAQHEISHVIHLAGLQVPVCRANPILGAQVNVLGTLAIFEAIRKHQKQIQGLVYASSAAVFGPPDDYEEGRVGNDVQLTPRTHYGVFKCCNEGNARIYHQDHGISSIGLRPWTVYGIGRDFGMTSEPTKAIKALALGRKYHISYGGLQDYQWVSDIAEIFIKCMTANYEGAKSYNIRGHVVDLETFHQSLCEVDKKAGELITHGTNQIPIAYDLDDEDLKKDLGPMPNSSLREGIHQTYMEFQRLWSEGRLDISDLEETP